MGKKGGGVDGGARGVPSGGLADHARGRGYGWPAAEVASVVAGLALLPPVPLFSHATVPSFRATKSKGCAGGDDSREYKARTL